MIFLPDYYGIEINDTLPLLTATRIMFIIFYIYAFQNRRRALSFKTIHLNDLPVHCFFFGGYFLFRIIANMYYLTTYVQSAKTIFTIIFEQLFLLIAIYYLAPTQKEIHTLLKVITWTATSFYIMGILESVTFIRPFDALYTISRNVMNEHYVRFGLLRSTTTFGMPGMYGNMCVLTLPIILYLYETYKQKRYLLSSALCFLAIIHSGSRSDLIFIAPILGIYFFIALKGYNRKLLFIKNFFWVSASVFLTCSLLSIASPHLKYFYVGTTKSILNEVGFDFDLNEGAPDDVYGFDAKARENDSKGSTARLLQFSGIVYTSSINPLFGLGSGAQNRKDIKYFWDNKWHTSNTYDVGYVEIFCDEGIIGSIGYIMMATALICIYSIIIRLPQKRCLLLHPIAYAIILLSTANMPHFLFLIVIIGVSFFEDLSAAET